MGERNCEGPQRTVHVRENSDHELDNLFKVALAPNKPHGIPLRERDLPASFFNPPNPQKQINHSREGSADSTGYSSTNHMGVIPSGPSRGPIHSRAKSAPAMVQQPTTFSTLPHPQHTRQRSCDLILEEQPLPPGWEMAKTPQGQIYFLK